ncbi:MAG: LysR family transcriptional regulator [Eggerthellaceae bacterium]|nr:LysR family transcriptional regulator [Eggerthellaceae bacterium]
MNKLLKLQPSVRISISNPESSSSSVFGRGIADLCLGVRESGSLNAAAKNMGMAYSKAWSIIRNTERALELQLLDRDGARGSTLTPDGNALLDAYIALDERMARAAQQSFIDLIS